MHQDRAQTIGQIAYKVAASACRFEAPLAAFLAPYLRPKSARFQRFFDDIEFQPGCTRIHDAVRDERPNDYRRGVKPNRPGGPRFNQSVRSQSTMGTGAAHGAGRALMRAPIPYQNTVTCARMFKAATNAISGLWMT